MKLALCLAFALVLTGCASPSPSVDRTNANAPASADLAERTIQRRAVEAVIWGIPAVNYERMLQAAIANGAKLNQVVYWSRPVNSKN